MRHRVGLQSMFQLVNVRDYDLRCVTLRYISTMAVTTSVYIAQFTINFTSKMLAGYCM